MQQAQRNFGGMQQAQRKTMAAQCHLGHTFCHCTCCAMARIHLLMSATTTGRFPGVSLAMYKATEPGGTLSKGTVCSSIFNNYAILFVAQSIASKCMARKASKPPKPSSPLAIFGDGPGGKMQKDLRAIFGGSWSGAIWSRGACVSGCTTLQTSGDVMSHSAFVLNWSPLLGSPNVATSSEYLALMHPCKHVPPYAVVALQWLQTVMGQPIFFEFTL
jgi:hypothetical protein